MGQWQDSKLMVKMTAGKERSKFCLRASEVLAIGRILLVGSEHLEVLKGNARS